jgi:acetolactate synthase-1/2/3 large subunit
MVTGGGAMHLNDSIGNNKGIKSIFNHHEQASAIAAEGYARVSGKPAIVCATTGPGALNTLNGVFGAFTDSVPMLVVAGQVKRDTISSLAMPGVDIRQLGDQEVKSISIVSSITKYSVLVEEPSEIAFELDKCFQLATTGRPGPVWLEIPVDVQGMEIDADPYSAKPISPMQEMATTSGEFDSIIEALIAAKRPVILAGSGIGISKTEEQLLGLAEATNTPVVTAWSHDVFDNEHALFAGRAGTIGSRPGNFVVQNADLVLVLGSRLSIRQVSYNWLSFAKMSKIIWVDIDKNEFSKPFPNVDIKVEADLRNFLPELVNRIKRFRHAKSNSHWLKWVAEVGSKYSIKPEDYPENENGINPYRFMIELSQNLRGNHVIACGNATACIVPFQTLKTRDQIRLFSNSGSASMGYDLPAAIGAAVADSSRPVISLAGDGSVMMNIQELSTLAASCLDVGLIILDNGGYLSIKQTQRNFFGRESGSSPTSGVSFPDFEKVANAFGLRSQTISVRDDWRLELKEFLLAEGPRVLVVELDQNQEFEPRLKSKMVNGSIQTPELDDMYPHLDEAELAAIRESALESIEVSHVE